ncbi:MAG: DUF2461 domain-containing protein [Chitinophagaceae bacterium]
MIQEATLQFLRELKENNNKAWFDEHRPQYDTAKADFENFVSEFLGKMSSLDIAFAEQRAKDCIYRIYRDVRFSKNKTPYKNHFSAYFAHGGRKWDGAGYYLQFEPGNIFAAGGMWMPPPSILKNIRQEIDYNFKEFQSILQDKKFSKTFGNLEGEKLQRPPQGYDAANPAIEFLKRKAFIVRSEIPDAVVRSAKAQDKLLEVFTTLSPLVAFLNRAVE